MKIRVALLGLIVSFASAAAQDVVQPFPAISAADQQLLSKRLVQYVSDYRRRDWKDLYDLVSTVGRGGAGRETFVEAMKAKHGGRDYADVPDLKSFKPVRWEGDDDGIDIYGCAKATREGEVFTGIAVVHAVRERDTWMFTGWRFTEFPNEPCTRLSDAKWKPQGPMEWSKPMDEVKGVAGSKPMVPK